MAVQAGFNTTSDNDLVPTETISGYIIPAANFVRVSQALAWVAPAPAGSTYRFPRWDAVAVTGTHTEADELSPTSFPTSNENVTGAVVGVHALATDQLVASSSMVTIEMEIARMVDEERNRMDKDILALFGGATNVSNHTGVNLGLDNWETALAAFKAQVPNMPRIAFVGSTNQIRDFRKAARAAGGGFTLGPVAADVYGNMDRTGYQGMYAGIEIYEGNTTQADADNDAGGFCACAPAGEWAPVEGLENGGHFQRGGGLGIAMWRLRDSFGVGAEMIRVPERVASRLVVSAMYGATITAEHLVRGFISKKAAA